MRQRYKRDLANALQVLNINELKVFYAIIVHYWSNYKYFISKQNFFNLWCELNDICHELDESFPDAHDDHKEMVSFCKAHPYYFIDILSPTLVNMLTDETEEHIKAFSLSE